MDKGYNYTDHILGEKYRIGKKIGSGSFGEIYLAKNIKTGADVALKLEVLSDSNSKSQLKREAKIYRMLEGEVGVSSIKWLGLSKEKNWLVMDLLGRSLEDLFNYCDRKFSLKTVLMIAYELLCRIETIHTRAHIIHRDIKPENFLMGLGRDRHTVYIIDFGLAKSFLNPRSNRHIPRKEGYSLTGTARYASLNAHEGYELSRRDDLISIGYVLVYLLKGRLPWQGLHGQTNEEKYRMIYEKKRSTSISELCTDLPEEFLRYFEEVNKLQYEEIPNYNYLKNLFKQLFVQNKFTYDNILYDWEIIAYQQRSLK